MWAEAAEWQNFTSSPHRNADLKQPCFKQHQGIHPSQQPGLCQSFLFR